MKREVGPSVSAHPATGALPGLSEVEIGLTLAVHAYHRCIKRCMAAAGAALSVTEILLLQTVRQRERPTRLADILLVLDIEESHVASYAIRKLEAAGFVETRRAGKEKFVAATDAGAALCDRYGAIRERLLAGAALGATETDPLSAGATLLRSLSGLYNQAARAAATL